MKSPICLKSMSMVLALSSSLVGVSLGSPLDFSLAFAGGEGGGKEGGGGGSVVCFDSPEVLAQVNAQKGALTNEQVARIESIETYDLAQARIWKPFGTAKSSLFLPKEGETEAQYFERLARRFDLTVPLVSDLVRQASENLRKAAMMTSWEGGVVQRDDANPSVKWDETRCALITTAYQYSQGDRLMVAVDSRLLEHPKNTQASRYFLYLHEGLYAIARARGQWDSRSTRDLISQITQAEIPLTAGELKDFVVGLGFAEAGTQEYNPATLCVTYEGSHHDQYCQRSVMTYKNAHTYNERLAVTTLNQMNAKLWDLIRRYDEANKELFDEIKKEFRYRMLREKLDYIPILGWIDAWTFNSACTSEQVDDFGPMKACVKNKYAYFLKSREQWVEKQIKLIWANKRAKLLKRPETDPSALKRVDSALNTFACSVQLFPPRYKEMDPIKTECVLSGWLDIHQFPNEMPTLLPAKD
jgi:hypothetical protein